MTDQRREVRLDLERLTEALNDVAPDYGTEHCQCGPLATPWVECPVHWALAVLERQEDAEIRKMADGRPEAEQAKPLRPPTPSEQWLAGQAARAFGVPRDWCELADPESREWEAGWDYEDAMCR